MKKTSSWASILQLLPLLAPKRKAQFLVLFSGMVFLSFWEMVNIGSIMPFLSALTDPNRILQNPIATPYINYFNIKNSGELLLPFGLIFGFVTILTNGLRLVVLWGGTRLSFAIGTDLSVEAFRAALAKPYKDHISTNSSEIITGIVKVNSAVSVINQVCALLNTLIVATAIILALFLINWLITLILIFSFCIIYLIIIRLTKIRLLNNSKKVSESALLSHKTLQEGLGGIRDILIDRTQEIYCDAFRKYDLSARRAQGSINITSNAPKYFLEVVGMLMILFLAYALLAKSNDLGMLVPTLGAFALGAQRLLPVLQQAYSSWIGIQAEKYALADFMGILTYSNQNHDGISEGKGTFFATALALKNISFSYEASKKLAISELNLLIQSGDRVGIIGASGGGKSTLVDILLGLLTPTSGRIEIDGKVLGQQISISSWQRQIAHVPQSIFLADASVAENIAFGCLAGQIDKEKVIFASKIAQIHNEINAWEFGYQTLVGERGVRISGGQRQRIGIARAIYKDASVIFLDEATSALDTGTESEVMLAINGLEKYIGKKITLFIVAHRLSTLKNCTKIIQIENGRLVREGAYDEVVLQSKT